MNSVFMKTVMLVLSLQENVSTVRMVITSVLRDNALSVAKPVKVVCVMELPEDAKIVLMVIT